MARTKSAPILNYEITGSGPTIVLLHGFMASTRYWEGVTAQLSGRYRVVAVDLLGFGNSPKPAFSRYDYDAHLRSLERTLEAAEVGRKFVLMGHSMGALMALRYARHNPARVQRLVLANMPIWMSAKEARSDVLGVHPVFKYVLNPVLHQVFWGVFRLSVKREWLPRGLGTDLQARASYIFQSSAAARLRSLRNVIYAASVETDLAALKVKTVLLSGLNDRQAYGQNQASLMLGHNIKTQALNGGHHLPLTHTADIVALIG